ncbi:MAG: NAD(P)-binding domain-containing protein, partial [Acidobacteriaceae bacterium]
MNMNVAFLGLGRMGTPIARLLVKSGAPLTVWNRTASRAEPLVKDGAQVAATAADAVGDADVVFTMLMDDRALDEVLGKDGVLERLKKGVIHVSLSTLSVGFSRKLSDEHQKRGLHFVAAPVFGRPHIAEAAKL